MSSRWAKEQLEKLGWKQGMGLGKDMNGSPTHMTPHLANQGKGKSMIGLGFATAPAVSDTYYEDAFSKGIAALVGRSKGRKKDKAIKTEVGKAASSPSCDVPSASPSTSLIFSESLLVEDAESSKQSRRKRRKIELGDIGKDSASQSTSLTSLVPVGVVFARRKGWARAAAGKLEDDGAEGSALASKLREQYKACSSVYTTTCKT